MYNDKAVAYKAGVVPLGAQREFSWRNWDAIMGDTAAVHEAPARRAPILPVDERLVDDAYAAYAAPLGERRMVQIVRPFAVMSRHTYSNPMTLPLGPAYLAAVLEKAGYRAGIIDAVGEDIFNIRPSADGTCNVQGLGAEAILERIDPDIGVLGVSMMFSQEWVLHREFIRAAREAFPDVIIVGGGEHGTALPEYVLRDCPEIDYLVLGEGELTFLELVHHLFTGEDPRAVGGVAHIDEAGKFVINGLSRRIGQIDRLPRPAWHLCGVENYFIDNWTMGISMGRNMPILATRGCPYQCTFCSNPTMWTTRYLMREPAEVVDEIEDLIADHGANSIDFFDLTAIVKKEWILAFCAEIERRGVDVAWQLPSGTRSEALDAETLAAIKRTGCRLLVYSPESGSPTTLEKVKKKIKLERAIASMREAVRVGHTVKLNFVIGFPHETLREVRQTLAFAWRMAVVGVDDCNISVYTPYPGSELFQQLRADEIIGELDDAYFNSLLAQFDMTIENAYCVGVSGRTLSRARFLGHAVFYLLAYLLHPSRLVRLVRGLFGQRFQARSLFEQRVSDMVARRQLEARGDGASSGS